MIIKIGSLELSDWTKCSDDQGWSRYKIIYYPTWTYHADQLVSLWTYDYDKKIVSHIRFYGKLYFLDKMYNPTNKQINLTVDDAKNSVDEFLLKIAKLKVFM